jgi:hypothetical protein
VFINCKMAPIILNGLSMDKLYAHVLISMPQEELYYYYYLLTIYAQDWSLCASRSHQFRVDFNSESVHWNFTELHSLRNTHSSALYVCICSHELPFIAAFADIYAAQFGNDPYGVKLMGGSNVH